MLNKSESIIKLSVAMAKFQKDLKQPMKDADNPFFKSKYVPLENVVEAITLAAAPHGLSFIQTPVNGENGAVGVSTLVLHESGEYIEFEPLFAMPKKANDVQQLGSTITYLRRYALSSIFGITSDNDDDGNAAVGNGQQQQQRGNYQQQRQQQQRQQQPQQGMLSDQQKTAIISKVEQLATMHNKELGAVYEGAMSFLKFNPKTPMNQLQPQQADTLINYLTKNGATD